MALSFRLMSDSSSPVTGTALGMGNGDNENDFVSLLKDHGIRKSRQHASARVLCVGGIELRMRNNLRQTCADFYEKGVCGLGAAFEIPVERLVDFFLGLRLDAKGL
jgi:hypothetical protein